MSPLNRLLSGTLCQSGRCKWEIRFGRCSLFARAERDSHDRGKDVHLCTETGHGGEIEVTMLRLASAVRGGLRWLLKRRWLKRAWRLVTGRSIIRTLRPSPARHFVSLALCRLNNGINEDELPVRVDFLRDLNEKETPVDASGLQGFTLRNMYTLY